MKPLVFSDVTKALGAPPFRKVGAVAFREADDISNRT
jgi:hypothetical protein